MRDEGPFGYLPGGIRHVAGLAIYDYCWLMLYFQGTGRHRPDDVRFLRREAIAALADYAAASYAKTDAGSTRPFWILGGEKPTEADFALFGYLAGVLATPP